MIDKENINTTDWLIRRLSAEELAKEKLKAIKEAEKELSRIEKKEKKKSMCAYRKMRRRHRKELVKLAKETRPFDYGWLDELVHTQIRHMHEYFSAGNNVWQTDETRLPIVEQLKYVLDLYDAIDNIWTSDNLGYDQCRNKEFELYQKLYSYVGEHLQEWWD